MCACVCVCLSLCLSLCLPVALSVCLFPPPSSSLLSSAQSSARTHPVCFPILRSFLTSSSLVAETVTCSAVCGASCWGPSDEGCQKPPPGKLVSNGTLVNATLGCPADTFELDLVCLPCNPLCGECSGPGETQCTACDAPMVLQGTECIADCSDGLFSQNQVCIPCSEEVSRRQSHLDPLLLLNTVLNNSSRSLAVAAFALSGPVCRSVLPM